MRMTPAWRPQRRAGFREVGRMRGAFRAHAAASAKVWAPLCAKEAVLGPIRLRQRRQGRGEAGRGHSGGEAPAVVRPRP